MTCPNCSCDVCLHAAQRAHAYWENFKPARHPDQDKIDAALERIKAMTPEEFHASTVRSGIHNEDGTLTAAYGGVDKTMNPRRRHVV